MTPTEKLNARIDREKQITKRCVELLLDAGYMLTINNGGDENEFKPSLNKDFIIAEMMQTDEEHLIVYEQIPLGTSKKSRFGWIFFVYGEDGWDVINNHTTNLDPIISLVQPLIDKLEKEANEE